MRRKIQGAAVYLVTALLLWYLFKDTDWANFAEVLRKSPSAEKWSLGSLDTGGKAQTDDRQDSQPTIEH